MVDVDSTKIKLDFNVMQMQVINIEDIISSESDTDSSEEKKESPNKMV